MLNACSSPSPTAGVQSILLTVVEEHGLPSGESQAPNCAPLVTFDANETLVVEANIATDTAPMSNGRAEKFRRADIVSPQSKIYSIIPLGKSSRCFFKR